MTFLDRVFYKDKCIYTTVQWAAFILLWVNITRSFMLLKQSSGIHFIYLFPKNQKETLNKIPTNMPVKTFYQTIAKNNSSLLSFINFKSNLRLC